MKGWELVRAVTALNMYFWIGTMVACLILRDWWAAAIALALALMLYRMQHLAKKVIEDFTTKGGEQ